MSLVAFLFASQIMLFPTFADLDRVATRFDSDLLASSKILDLVYISGKFSHVEYQARLNTQPISVEFPIYSFHPRLTFFGNCNNNSGVLSRKKDRNCGYIVPFTNSNDSVNFLGYNELSLNGQFSGNWGLAFADSLLAASEENVPLGLIDGAGTRRFPIDNLYKSADVGRSRYLVFLLASQSGSARLEQVTLQHIAGNSHKTGIAVWIWDRNQVIGHEKSVLDKLKYLSIKRIYLQVGDDLEVFDDFLHKALRYGIEVYALDGEPEYLTAPELLISRIQAVETFNCKHPDTSFAGFQIDIEPYLNKDFSVREEYYTKKYVELVNAIKVHFSIPLSIVVPFWFDSLYIDGRTLIQRIVEVADEVVVMSYRTNLKSVQEISRSTLALGEIFNKPVWLGVELGKIPDEHHVILEKCSSTTDARAIKIGNNMWFIQSEYDIRGDKISFNSKISELPSFMKGSIPYGSFKGWVLHSYEELP